MLIKQFAEQALLDSGIQRLPIRSSDIREYLQTKGWIFAEFYSDRLEDDELIQASGTMEIAKRTPCFVFQLDDFKCVFYNARLSEAEKIKGFAHELGHIMLGHISYSDVLGYTSDSVLNEPQEEEANEFAIHFLAPSCVLRRTRLASQDALKAFTALSGGSLERACANLYGRQPSTLTERSLLKRFKPFLTHQNRLFYKRAGAIFIGFGLLTGLLGFAYIHTAAYESQPGS